MNPAECVFLFDCDNTLLDNDRVQDELRTHRESEFGTDCRDRYRNIFEDLRVELGYADYLGALQRYRLSVSSDPRVLQMSAFLIDYTFADRLYPDAVRTIEYFSRQGHYTLDARNLAVYPPANLTIERIGNLLDLDLPP